MKNSLSNTLILKISFLVLVFGLVIVLLIKGSLTEGIDAGKFLTGKFFVLSI